MRWGPRHADGLYEIGARCGASPGPYGGESFRILSGLTGAVLQTFDVGPLQVRFADSVAALPEERLVFFGASHGGRPSVSAFRLNPFVDR